MKTNSIVLVYKLGLARKKPVHWSFLIDWTDEDDDEANDDYNSSDDGPEIALPDCNAQCIKHDHTHVNAQAPQM